LAERNSAEFATSQCGCDKLSAVLKRRTINLDILSQIRHPFFILLHITATARKWSFVVGVRSGMSQSLYFDGVLADTSIQAIFPGTTRYTGFDIMIGKKVNSPDYFFSGMIDEVRISSVALTPDWIKLCYMNQKDNDALVRMNK
jgi:Concanavalin A-like lectin/glucanases superfamily